MKNLTKNRIRIVLSIYTFIFLQILAGPTALAQQKSKKQFSKSAIIKEFSRNARSKSEREQLIRQLHLGLDIVATSPYVTRLLTSQRLADLNNYFTDLQNSGFSFENPQYGFGLEQHYINGATALSPKLMRALDAVGSAVESHGQRSGGQGSPASMVSGFVETTYFTHPDIHKERNRIRAFRDRTSRERPPYAASTSDIRGQQRAQAERYLSCAISSLKTAVNTCNKNPLGTGGSGGSQSSSTDTPKLVSSGADVLRTTYIIVSLGVAIYTGNPVLAGHALAAATVENGPVSRVAQDAVTLSVDGVRRTIEEPGVGSKLILDCVSPYTIGNNSIAGIGYAVGGNGLDRASLFNDCNCDLPGYKQNGAEGWQCNSADEKRADCQRNPYDERGAPRRECTSMLINDIAATRPENSCGIQLCIGGTMNQETCQCSTSRTQRLQPRENRTSSQGCAAMQCPRGMRATSRGNGNGCSCQ